MSLISRKGMLKLHTLINTYKIVFDMCWIYIVFDIIVWSVHICNCVVLDMALVFWCIRPACRLPLSDVILLFSLYLNVTGVYSLVILLFLLEKFSHWLGRIIRIGGPYLNTVYIRFTFSLYVIQSARCMFRTRF